MSLCVMLISHCYFIICLGLTQLLFFGDSMG